MGRCTAWIGSVLLLLLICCVSHAAANDSGPPTTLLHPRQTPTTQPAATTQPSDSSDVAEVVYRYLIDQVDADIRRKSNYYFLGLDDINLPPAFLARFADSHAKALPASMARTSEQLGVEHRYLGGRGVLFQIGSFAWIDANTVHVRGEIRTGACPAPGSTFVVERRAGKWVLNMPSFGAVY